MKAKAATAGLCLTLAACGGGGGGGSDPDTPPPVSEVDGIWRGSFVSDSTGSYSLLGLIKDGEIRMLSADNGSIHAGTASVASGGVFSATTTDYAIGGTVYAETSMTGSYVQGQSISADYTATNGDSGTVSLTYDELYDRDSSLALTEGIWSVTEGAYTFTITIQADGTLDGSDTDGCIYSGSVSIIDSNKNLYDVDVSAANCGVADGDYNGYGVISDDQSANDTFSLVANNENYIIYGDLTRQ